jgi:pilus assembly protein CpaB
MNRSRLVMIGLIALALGAFVAYSVYRTLQNKVAGGNEPAVDVVVSTGDLQVGARLADKDVRVARFPSSLVPPGSFKQKSQVVGRGVVQPIMKGEFILPTKLAAENAGSGLPSLIPPGMRAVSVRVNEVVSVAGFVTPGARVDVLLTGNPTTSNEPQTSTVLENVEVVAVGQKLERNTTGDAQNAAVITLLVSPDDAQKLTLASTQGKIQLALRNPVDTHEQQLDSTRANVLYKSVSNPEAAPKPRIVKKAPVTAPAPPTAPSTYVIEVIRGTKVEEQKF